MARQMTDAFRVKCAVLLVLGVSCCGKPSSVETPPASCVVPDTGLPFDVFCTGLYADGSADAYSADVMPYTPGVTLWSDGAEKHRYLYLPPSTQIDTSVMDAWKFPAGTKVWKEFKVGGVRVETRLLWKRSSGKWDIGTYVWSEDQKAATLNTNAKGLILPSGYEIPTAKDCDKCHHGGADKVLGVEAVALGLPRAQGATLAVLVGRGLLSQPPPTTSIDLPEDATGKAGEALGYLHANCGMPCHSTRGLGDETHLVMRLRAGEFWADGTTTPDGGTPTYPLAAMRTDSWAALIDQIPTTGAVAQAFPNAYRVKPGAHEQSLIWKIANLRGTYQMPPLVSHSVDTAGMQTLADWIDAIQP